MNIEDIISTLITWTPFLLAGFGWNILIAFTALVLGSTIGVGLAFLKMSTHTIANRTNSVIAECSRNIPTLVLQFYLAVMLPSSVPGWVKTSLALSVAAASFVADNLPPVIRDWQQNQRSKAMLFLPAWTTLFVNLVMTSAGASLIGVNEIVSRCNVVVNATGNTSLLIPIYLYAGLFFLAFCYPLTVAMQQVRKKMVEKDNAKKSVPVPPTISATLPTMIPPEPFNFSATQTTR
jgi:polar amino acid transport system permease protein